LQFSLGHEFFWKNKGEREKLSFFEKLSKILLMRQKRRAIQCFFEMKTKMR